MAPTGHLSLHVSKPGIGILVGATCCLVALAGILWWQNLQERTLNIVEPQTLLIEPGDHLRGLGRRLAAKGWLPWTVFQFDVYSRLTEQDGHIKSGEYRLDPTLTVPQLLARLRSGDVIQRSITFPEGLTTRQWLTLLEANPTLQDNTSEFLSQAIGDPRMLEGRWYPDTYSFTRGDAALDLLSRAEDAMDMTLASVWARRSDNVAVETPEQALVLASIIEKETGYEGDRRLIASVFSNRLRLGMKLQSDPTVIYGLENFDGDLKRRHLSVKHPYNTYVINGLPVAPICHPGRASLEAAVNPETSSYLYFVAKGDGRSHFSETLEEHNRAVVRYQKSGRVENYRSAPPIESDDGQ